MDDQQRAQDLALASEITYIELPKRGFKRAAILTLANNAGYVLVMRRQSGVVGILVDAAGKTTLLSDAPKDLFDAVLAAIQKGATIIEDAY